MLYETYLKLFFVLFSTCLPILGINGNTSVEERIIGGSVTGIEDAPYMAYFTIDNDLYCGGFIVNKREIVTAAHCVNLNKLNNTKIKVGSSNIGKFTQNFDVAKLLKHPKFNNVTMEYDVAVVTINGTFQLSQSVSSITLADKDLNLSEGELVKITGWGSTEKADTSNQLLEVNVPIVAQETCIKEYATINVTITKNMVCAGIANKDSCAGDSGGPLIYKGKVAGIVSFGEKCGLPGFPGVYTRVSAMRPWLDTVLDFE